MSVAIAAGPVARDLRHLRRAAKGKTTDEAARAKRATSQVVLS